MLRTLGAYVSTNRIKSLFQKKGSTVLRIDRTFGNAPPASYEQPTCPRRSSESQLEVANSLRL